MDMGIAWAETWSSVLLAPGRLGGSTRNDSPVVFGFSCVISRRRKTGAVPAGGHDTWVTLCLSLGLLDVNARAIQANEVGDWHTFQAHALSTLGSM